MSVLVSLCFEIARAAALSVALAHPPSSGWLERSRVTIKRSDPEYIASVMAKHVEDPAFLAKKRFVNQGLAESETFFKARDYVAAENRLRATLQGCDGIDEEYLCWMLAEKLFLQKRFAECREVLAPVLRANWDEPPLLMYAISCLQTGTDNLDIRRYIKKQAEHYEAMPGFPETMPRVVTRDEAIAAGYYALSRRESGRFPLNEESMGEAHRLLPQNVYIAICYAAYGEHGLGSLNREGARPPEWAASVLKSVLPFAHGKLRTRLVNRIHEYDKTFRDSGT